jgi:hypothetical protein
MRRARDLIDSKAPLSTICLHHYEDPEYLPIAFAKQRAKAAEQKKKQEEALEKRLQLQDEAQKKKEEQAKAKEAQEKDEAGKGALEAGDEVNIEESKVDSEFEGAQDVVSAGTEQAESAAAVELEDSKLTVEKSIEA